MHYTSNQFICIALIGCLCATMLTACAGIKFGIVDPTEQVKIASPLAQSFAIFVDQKVLEKRGAYINQREYVEPFLKGDLLRAVSQSLLTSEATSIVEPSTTCAAKQQGLTLCITAAPFNHESSFGENVARYVAPVIAVLGLGIPALFMSDDYHDWVTAEVKLLDKTGTMRATFEVKSEFNATNGGGVNHAEFIRRCYEENNKELAKRIVLELKRHPHWFEPSTSPAP